MKLFEIKDDDKNTDPGKLAIGAIIISVIVIALTAWTKNGYYDKLFSQGVFADSSELMMRKIISISLSVLPSALMIAFHLIVKITNKTSKVLAALLLCGIIALCANGIFETFSLVNAYLTENELRKDLCFILIGGCVLSAGAASNGLKTLKVLPPA
ncbi:MAG: hypothetical protein J6X94_02480 [Lachnospiraceae bacterium]|nr:hypothetical protein [Lachnospiraceae bacterium]